MSTFTIFKTGHTVHHDLSYDNNAIAIVNCDEKYNIKIIQFCGYKGLKQLIKKSKDWKYFIHIDIL